MIEELDGVNANEPQFKKPPLGVEPEYIWRHRRIIELIKAVARYEEARIAYPDEWMTEIGELIKRERERGSGG